MFAPSSSARSLYARSPCWWWLCCSATVLLIVVGINDAGAQYLNVCRLPEGLDGTCVLVRECPFIRAVLQKPLLIANDVRYLEATRCGTLESKALVCCLSPEVSSNGAAPVQPVQPALPDPVNRLGSQEDRRKLLPEQCGIQYDDRIIGGERASIDAYPWLALVSHTDRRGERKFHCGGSLINDRYVVTAAHCIENIPRTWTLDIVRLGEWDLQSGQDCSTLGGETICAEPVQDIAIANTLVHPEFRASRMEVKNDIALLRLAAKVNYNDYVAPICLPLSTDFQSKSYDNQRFVVAGWGQTEEAFQSRYKLFVGVSGVSQQQCRESYPMANIDDTQICAGGTVNKDACRGDSGGPLMQHGTLGYDTVMYLTGVVSFGKKCGLAGVPGVYTRVDRFTDWIVNSLQP